MVGIPARHYAPAAQWRRGVRAWLRDARDPHVKRAFVGGSLEGLLGGQAALVGLAGLGSAEFTEGLGDTAKGLGAGLFAHAATEAKSTSVYFLAHEHGGASVEHAQEHETTRGRGCSDGHVHGHGHVAATAASRRVPKLAAGGSTAGLVGGAALPLGVAAATGSVVLGAATGGVGLFALGALATAKFTGQNRWRCGLEHLKLGAIASGFFYAATTGVQALATGAGLGSLGVALPAAVGLYAGLKGARWVRRRQQRKRAAALAAMVPPTLYGPRPGWADRPTGRVSGRGHGHGHDLGHGHAPAPDSGHSHERKRASSGVIR